MTVPVADPGVGPDGAFGLRVARNAATAFGGQVAVLLLGLLATALFVRLLGAERFGGWSLIAAVVAYAGLLDLGLGVSLVRRVAAAADERQRAAALSAGLAATVLLGIAAVALVWLLAPSIAAWLGVAPALRAEFVTALKVCGVAAGLTLPGVALGAVPPALQRLDVVVRLEVRVTAAALAVQSAVLLAGAGLVAVAWVFLAGRAASLAGRWWLARSMVGRISLRPDPSYPFWGELGQFGLLKVAHQLLSQVVLYLDRFLVGALVSVEAVAWYALAVELAQKVLIVQGNVAQAFYPAACARAADRPALGGLYLQASRAVALLTFPLAVALAVLAEPLLTIWVGAAIAERSADLLRLVALAYAVMALTSIPAAAADALGRPGISVRYGALSVAINAVLAVVLIPRLGVVGAGWAIVGNVVLQAPFFVRAVTGGLVGTPVGAYARRALVEPLGPAVILALALAGAWTLGAGLGALRLPAAAAAGAAGYALALRWMSRFEESERRFVAALPGGGLLRWVMRA